jgi:membrane protein YqaA with SNARE-associated domain
VRFLDRLGNYLMPLGIPGLLAISFLDSAAVPIVGGPDALVMLLAWHRPTMTWLVVLAATVGSMLGCLVLYGIGRKGGEKALSRFSPERAARIERRMQEYGVWAVIAAVLAPPPFPTKLVVLAAGVLRIGKVRFTVGTFTGRLVRYSLLGFLAARFGDQAAQLIKKNTPVFSAALIVGVLIIIAVRVIKKRAAERSEQ